VEAAPREAVALVPPPPPLPARRMGAAQAKGKAMTRQNSKGDPCPSWCVTDHDRYDFHGSEPVSVTAADYWTYRASAVRFWEGDDRVAVSGCGQFYVSAEGAEDLAGTLDRLAGGKPEDLRALAAAIRQAAETITQPAAESRNHEQ
jgi:hypothetical protein